MAQDMTPVRSAQTTVKEAERRSGPIGQGVVRGATHLSGAQKAAVIVRLVLARGEQLPLTQLPDDLQAELATQIAALRLIDRHTLKAVAEEFIETLDQVGLAFHDGLDGALDLLGNQLSETTRNRLRSLARGGELGNPWTRLERAQDVDLVALLLNERPQIGAVVLSKLPTARAAKVLAALPGDKARELALAVAQTDAIGPDTVQRIGQAVARQLEARPARAFSVSPEGRIGAILDAAPTPLRNAVLEGIAREDARLAGAVRRKVFVYANIAERVAPLDVPRIIRVLDRDTLLTVLRGTQDAPDTPEGAATEFLLKNSGQRVANTLREEAEARPMPVSEDLDGAMIRVVSAIRLLADSGELVLVKPAGSSASDNAPDI